MLHNHPRLLAPLLLTLLIACAPESTKQTAGTEVLRIAVASNFRPAFETLASRFMQEHKDIQLKASFASSGTLYAQISNGARYNIFLSADSLRAQSVRAQQDQDVELFTYAFGTLALWVPDTLNPDLAWLKQYRGHMAIANPELAPYGQAAKVCLDKLLDNKNNTQLILGSSVAQAFHYVASGTAGAGIVAKSQLLDYAVKSSHYWLLPVKCYPAIEQQAVTLATTSPEQKVQIRVFMTFLKSETAKSIIQNAGYLPAPN